LGLRLPQKTRKDGADIRARLTRIGIYRESGHEHFNGSLTVPVLDAGGNVTEVYGRKLRDDLRPGTPQHLYLPGPHRGVWNLPGLAASGGEIILAEALIDAVSFWCAGFRNVTAAYGVEGFTADHLAAFREHRIDRVLIAFDRDPAGERGAAKVAETLIAAGIECYRVEFPKGMDANDYALKGDARRQIAGRADPQGGMAWPGKCTGAAGAAIVGNTLAQCGSGRDRHDDRAVVN
jgi:DNA primase